MTFLEQAKCSSCSLNCGRKILPEGPLSPDLMIIGDSPNINDHYKQQIFISNAGILLKQVLNQMFEAEHIGQQTVYYTNTVLCRPPDRQPTDQEIANCFARLNAEIDLVQPKRILLLGAVAGKAILGIKKISESRGKISEYRGIPTMLTWHPSYILNNQTQMQTFVNDIEHLIQKEDLLHKKNTKWLTPREFEFVTTSDRLAKIFEEIAGHLCALDIETWGTNPWSGFILYVGIKDTVTNKNYIIPHSVFETQKHLWPENLPVIVHESKFEWQWFKRHYDIELNNIYDTLLMYHVLDERSRGVSKSLKNLGQERLGVHEWDAELSKFMANLHMADQEKVKEYLCYDIDVTAELFEDVKQEMVSDGCWEQPYMNIMKPAVPFINKIMNIGFRVDLEYLESEGERLDSEIARIKDKIQQIVGKKDFNPGSPPQLAEYLFMDLGFPRIQGTSTNESCMKELNKYVIDNEIDNPIIDLVMDFRAYSKINSTYVKGLYKVCDYDGRIHTKILLEGTETGRMSSKEPNMHNIPRPGESVINIRRAFLPEEGYKILDVDYAQLELRVGAHQSQDLKLIEDINNGMDMHRRFASFVLGIPENEVTKVQRQFAKNMVFAVMFDADERSLVYTFKKDFPFITQELAGKAINLIRHSYPELYFQALRNKRFVLENGWIGTQFGRKRRFPLITKENRAQVMRQATNAPIQGTASDICLLSAIEIDRRVLGPIIHILVHDSIVMSIPEGFDTGEIKEIMTTMPFETNVKFDVEFKISDRWGE